MKVAENSVAKINMASMYGIFPQKRRYLRRLC